MTPENKKKVFLLISERPERLVIITNYLEKHYQNPILYTAPSNYIGHSKIKNAAIDILIIDSENNASDALKMVELIFLENINSHMAIIIIGHLPQEQQSLDELVTGKLYFIDKELHEGEFSKNLTKALNFTSHSEPAIFYLRYLAAGDTLIKAGDKAEFVYILKSGLLQAYNISNGKKIILGNIETGEFVGEMAYINGGPRSAYIEAVTDAELIEVPIGDVDNILYKRPSWSKALMQTLSKRLQNANQHFT